MKDCLAIIRHYVPWILSLNWTLLHSGSVLEVAPIVLLPVLFLCVFNIFPTKELGSLSFTPGYLVLLRCRQLAIFPCRVVVLGLYPEHWPPSWMMNDICQQGNKLRQMGEASEDPLCLWENLRFVCVWLHVCMWSAKDQTQGLIHARQMLHDWDTSLPQRSNFYVLAMVDWEYGESTQQFLFRSVQPGNEEDLKKN